MCKSGAYLQVDERSVCTEGVAARSVVEVAHPLHLTAGSTRCGGGHGGWGKDVSWGGWDLDLGQVDQRSAWLARQGARLHRSDGLGDLQGCLNQVYEQGHLK